jgi:hypothetical protein
MHLSQNLFTQTSFNEIYLKITSLICLKRAQKNNEENSSQIDALIGLNY